MIVDNIVKNASSREKILKYLENLLKANQTRSNLQTNEKLLCTDGFMLNILYSLQELAMPIKIDKIDLNHPFISESRILVRDDEARLNCTKETFVEWHQKFLQNLTKIESNFHTDCFFLAFSCHHLSIIPLINKYNRRLRVIKELNKYLKI